MSIFERIQKPKPQPVIATILGEPGVGKTSLAAAFPAPIFLKVEDGTEGIPAELKEGIGEIKVEGVDDLWSILGSLLKEEHDYKTVVLDSVTKLETVFQDYVVANDPKKPRGINQANGGYGAGFLAVGSLHQRVRKAAGLLQEKGVHVLFLAHVEIDTLDLPDQDPFSRYGLRLNKRSLAPYVDDVSMVALVRLETFTKGDADDKRKKAVGSGGRIITAHSTPSSITKNRYYITDDIAFPVGTNPLADYIPSLNR